MKNITPSFLLVLAVGLSVVGAKADTSLLNETFEEFTAGTVFTTSTANHGWIVGQASLGVPNGTVEVSNAQAHAGSNSLYLLDNSSGYSASARYFGLSQTVSTGYVDYWLKTDSAYGTVNYSLGFVNSTGANNFSLAISATSVTFANSSGTSLGSATISFDTANWNDVRVAFDDTGKTLTVSLNSVTALSLSSAELSGVTLGASRLYFVGGYGSGTNTGVYLDDISVVATSAIPEPSTFAALSGLAALGAMLMIRRGSRRRAA